MDQFTRAWKQFVPDSKRDGRTQPPLPYSQQEWDSTSRSAAMFARDVLGKKLTDSETRMGARIVHFTVGAAGGALYGTILGQRVTNRVLAGTGFGLALWLVGEEVLMPALGINDPARSYSVAMHANSLGEHVAYGITTGLISTGLLATW